MKVGEQARLFEPFAKKLKRVQRYCSACGVIVSKKDIKCPHCKRIFV